VIFCEAKKDVVLDGVFYKKGERTFLERRHPSFKVLKTFGRKEIKK